MQLISSALCVCSVAQGQATIKPVFYCVDAGPGTLAGEFSGVALHAVFTRLGPRELAGRSSPAKSLQVLEAEPAQESSQLFSSLLLRENFFCPTTLARLQRSPASEREQTCIGSVATLTPHNI